MLAMAEKIRIEEAGKVGLGGLGGEGGNTHFPLPETKSLQIPKRKNHFFTINNYTEEQIGGLLEYFNTHAKLFVFQEEIAPTTGTPHLQGVVSFDTEKRSTVWDPTSRGQWKPLKGSVKDCITYCSKEETRKPNGRQWSKGIPKPLKLISPDKWWQKEILELLDKEPDDRAVHWYWSDKGGIGKSQFAKYCVAKKNCLFFEEGKKSDIMHLIFEAPDERLEAMIIDVPRDNGNNISYKAIESIKNGMIYSPKYEGGYKLFNSPHIIVFANKPPQEERLSSDRWHIKNLDE